MKPFNELKEGDHLYNLSYHPKGFFSDLCSKREMWQVTVKRLRGRTALLKGGYAWGITERMYGDEWFPSKLECYKRALELHEIEFEDIEETYKRFRKEMCYLRRKIREGEKDGQ